MDTYIGSIELFPYLFAPQGWLLCNGAVLPVQPNQALFALLGNVYGGDGRTTFAIPNYLGYEPLPGLQYYIATEGEFPVRD